jgi:two-component system cell cycle sensor histidine kinase/response regulator CckA
VKDNTKTDHLNNVKKLKRRIGELETKNAENAEKERNQVKEELHQYAEQMALLLKSNEALSKSLDMAEILQILTDSAAGIIDNGSAAVYILNDRKLYLGATTPALPPDFPEFLRDAPLDDHPHIEQVVTTESPYILPDTKSTELTDAEREVSEMRSLRTIAYIPLVGNNGVLGVFIVASVNEPRPFSEFHLTLCHTLAAQASIAIENAHLYKSLQDELEQRKQTELVQTAIYKIAESVHTTKNLKDLFRAVHEHIGVIMPAKNFYIALHDPETDLLHFEYYVDEHDPSQYPIKTTEGLTGCVFRNGTPLLVTPEFEKELLKRKEVTEIGPPAVSWLGVPLKIDDQVKGVLAVQSYSEDVRYGEKEKSILEYVSRQVASVIQRKRVEEERIEIINILKENEERYRLIVENANDGIEITQNDRILYANKRFAEMLGYTTEELNDLRISQVFTEQAAAELEERGKLRQSGEIVPKNYETTLYKKDHSIIHVEVNYETIKYKDAPATFAIIRDINERKQAEAEMARLIAAIEQAGEVFVITDTEGTIQYVNPSFEQVTGFKKDEVIGQNPRIFQSGEHDKAFYQELWDTLLRGKTWRGRIVNKKKDGTNYTEDAVISPVRDESGRTIYYAAVKRDVTEQLRTSEMLHQSQKMQIVGQLAGGIAHDFNNLLTIINGYSDLILGTEIPSRLKLPLEQIKNAGERAARLTTQLLAFSRKQIIQPKIIDLNQLVTEQIKMLRRLLGEDIEIITLLTSENVAIKADPGQIEQIVMNITINARDAMPKGGKLTIETDIKHFDKDYIKNHPGTESGQYAMLAVSDTGIGMSEAIKAHIFEPFFTTKGRDRGTGLGLATVYGIVSQNKGFIYVYSEENKGSTFKIYFPLMEQASNVLSNIEDDSDSLHGEETILLVEDDTGVRNITERTLSEYGYSVITASNGEEGFRLYNENKDKVDLLLTDVIMPLMSGKELSEKLLKENPDLKVIFFSGYTDNSIVHHGILDEGVEFIQKPYSHIDLAKRIKDILTQKK